MGILSLLALACLLSAEISLAAEEDQAWSEFKSIYNKNYSSEAEEQSRREIFLDNVRFIESHNTKESRVSFTQGLNPLSDLTAEEIVRSRCGFRLEPSEEHHAGSGPSAHHLIESLLSALNITTDQNQDEKAWYDQILSPLSLDWRSKGRVSRVKDQGSCGSCWSFASTGALESYLASRGREVLLSEQNLVDCSRAYGNHGCAGGLMGLAFRYVRDHGIMSSSAYPYTGQDGQCRFRREASVTRVAGSVTLPRGNEALLRLVVARFGPVPVAIDASPRSFHSYKSGVYDDTVCRNSNSALNHAVLLVGYGTDKTGGDYWLIKNSWGNKWGDSGYIKMARNRRNFCGIASYAVVPIV